LSPLGFVCLSGDSPCHQMPLQTFLYLSTPFPPPPRARSAFSQVGPISSWLAFFVFPFLVVGVFVCGRLKCLRGPSGPPNLPISEFDPFFRPSSKDTSFVFAPSRKQTQRLIYPFPALPLFHADFLVLRKSWGSERLTCETFPPPPDRPVIPIAFFFLGPRGPPGFRPLSPGDHVCW